MTIYSFWQRAHQELEELHCECQRLVLVARVARILHFKRLAILQFAKHVSGPESHPRVFLAVDH